MAQVIEKTSQRKMLEKKVYQDFHRCCLPLADCTGEILDLESLASSTGVLAVRCETIYNVP